MTRNPLLAIVGPTGSGKSDLAVALAQEFGGEVVNFDSVQVYRTLDIGSAKTPVSERKSIPHHLLDIIAPSEELTAGAFSNLARAALRDISDRANLPILTGGTGFYLRSLLDGLSPAPPRNTELRERLSASGAKRPGSLHRFLRTQDPEAAARIHPNDHQKLIRAIELACVTCGAGAKPAPRDALQGYRVCKIGLQPDRAKLYGRINGRVVKMFESGLLQETQALLNAGLSPVAKPLLSLGYKQAAAYLRGQLSLEEAIEDCQTKTRQYAKRQLTWFRAEPGVQWLQGFGTDSSVHERARDLTKAFLTPPVLP